MPRKKVTGECHLCGRIGPLTFEHVPPKSAFNDKPVLKGKLEDFLLKGLEPSEKEQRGAGDFTLCGQCNNSTGSWYGPSFVEWCYQGLLYLQRSNSCPSLHYPFYIYPLRIIKQIIAMFFSINHSGFHKIQSELAAFVLNRDKRYLDPSIRIYTYFKTGSRLRQSSVIGVASVLESGTFSLFSEIAFPPMGYILVFDSPPPDDRLLDITFFTRYSYHDQATIFLKMPVLPVNIYTPGDFRSWDKIIHQETEKK